MCTGAGGRGNRIMGLWIPRVGGGLKIKDLDELIKVLIVVA